MAALDWAATLFLLTGTAFVSAGTLGLLRFPDVYTRLHALAKVDNLGLGCIVVGLLLRAPAATGAKLVLVWLLVLACSGVVSFLVARRARRSGVQPWRAP